MKSFANLDSSSTETALIADEILEFHASRLLLLFQYCGAKGRVEGLTKMAKLDFFARYPVFFERVRNHLDQRPVPPSRDGNDFIGDASMIRFHYGPWDPRYYHVLAYLESRSLITIEKRNATYVFELTELGVMVSKNIGADPLFSSLVDHLKVVKIVLGKKNGSALKKLVYEVFDEEVAQKSIGEPIVP